MIILACIPCMRKRFSKDISSPITVNILLCTDTILAQYDGLRIPDVSFPFRIPESSHLLLIILLTHGCVLLPQAIGSNNKNTDSMSNTVSDNGCTEFVHLIFEKTIMFQRKIAQKCRGRMTVFLSFRKHR